MNLKKKKKKNYRNRFHFRISLVSTAQFQQTKIPSQETRDFKKKVNFDLKVFIFIESFHFSLTFGWARNLNFSQTNLGVFLLIFQSFLHQARPSFESE